MHLVAINPHCTVGALRAASCCAASVVDFTSVTKTSGSAMHALLLVAARVEVSGAQQSTVRLLAPHDVRWHDVRQQKTRNARKHAGFEMI